jgi:hypothetical protein
MRNLNRHRCLRRPRPLRITKIKFFQKNGGQGPAIIAIQFPTIGIKLESDCKHAWS